MPHAIKTSSASFELIFDRDFLLHTIWDDHPQWKEMDKLVKLRVQSEDLKIDPIRYPDLDDYRSHAWDVCRVTLEHHFPEVEFWGIMMSNEDKHYIVDHIHENS